MPGGTATTRAAVGAVRNDAGAVERLWPRAARVKLVVIFLMAAVVPATVRAGEDSQDRPDDTREIPATQRAVATGSFAALTMPARVGSTKAFAWGVAGYDSGRKRPLFDTTAEVQLWGPIAVRGGATYSPDSSRMRPSLGARAQLLRQEKHGVDGALGVSYKAEGFNEPEGEIETFVMIGHQFDTFYVAGNLGYGQDPEGNERDGEFRGTVFRQAGRFSYGLDSRARLAIGTPRGGAAAVEPKYDVMGGPLATLTLGPLALFGEVGPSAISLGGLTSVGVAAFGGVGSAF